MPVPFRPTVYLISIRRQAMPLLHPGDTFPQLTPSTPGAQAIQVPGWFAGEFGVLLFNRGAWCPYCTAQSSEPVIP
jgi:peroxiredoxin